MGGDKPSARASILAEMDRAQQKVANLRAGLAEARNEIERWEHLERGLRFALEAMGPAPKRGRPAAAANGSPAQKPRRARKPVAVLQDPVAASLTAEQVGK